MIPCCGERISDPLKNAFSIMFYSACFSMHQPPCLHDFSPELVNYPLIPEANSQCGYLAAHLLQNIGANSEVACFFGCAGSWGNDYALGVQLHGLFEGYLVVSVNDWFSSEFPNVLDKIVDERVIIVDNQNFYSFSLPETCNALISA